MIFKRILSNLIDLLLYFLVFVILFKTSGLEINQVNADFIYFLTFIITIILPIVTNSNTIGKIFLKQRWSGLNVKFKLLIKYSIYFISVVPSISFFSAIINCPPLEPLFGNLDKLIFVKILLILAISDIIVFLLSMGKYHILDYILNIFIDKHPYRKTATISLGILYLSCGLLFIGNTYAYKYNISLFSLTNTLASYYFKEQYPTDNFYGKNVYTIKEHTISAFCPSDPSTFLVNKNISQKTLYLNLPKNVFNSEYERKALCVKLIEQSLVNDHFNFYKPKITRIVLSNVEQGDFFEYYNYLYFYYFDPELPQWGIYGGIQADSLTLRAYSQFICKYYTDKRSSIEKECNLKWETIVKKCKNDSIFEKRILEMFTYNLKSATYNDQLSIKRDSSILELYRIPFSQAYHFGYMGINFPFYDLDYRVNLTNLMNENIFDYDDNVYYLKFLREEITNKEF